MTYDTITPMKGKVEQLVVRVHPEVKARLELLATQNNRPVAWVVTKALREYDKEIDKIVTSKALDEL